MLPRFASPRALDAGNDLEGGTGEHTSEDREGERISALFTTLTLEQLQGIEATAMGR